MWKVWVVFTIKKLNHFCKMSTGRKRSLSGPACSSPAKRKKYLCKYQKAWEAEFSWLSHSDRSINDAYCILCKSHLSVGSGARNDLTRHAKSQNHMQLEMVQRIHRIQIRFEQWHHMWVTELYIQSKSMLLWISTICFCSKICRVQLVIITRA